MDSVTLYTEMELTWFDHKHISQAIAIEMDSFQNFWDKKDFQIVLDNGYHGLALMHGNGMLGFMVFYVSKRFVEVSNLAIDINVRRKKLASWMVQQLRLMYPKHELRTLVSESQYGANCFWKSLHPTKVRAVRPDNEEEELNHLFKFNSANQAMEDNQNHK
jgi:ribosomal protein S18 acetylase RimI-like enzyme